MAKARRPFTSRRMTCAGRHRRGLNCARLLAVVLALAASGAPDAAQAQAWQLVCFERDGLTERLDTVSNPSQFLRNDRNLRSGSCDFARIPRGSQARFSGFHETRSGFIFPIFRVRYATTGQRMYAADGVFRTGGWRVSRRFQDCRAAAFDDICLVPQSCDVLAGTLNAGGVAGYIAIPPSCRTYRIE